MNRSRGIGARNCNDAHYNVQYWSYTPYNKRRKCTCGAFDPPTQVTIKCFVVLWPGVHSSPIGGSGFSSFCIHLLTGLQSS